MALYGSFNINLLFWLQIVLSLENHKKICGIVYINKSENKSDLKTIIYYGFLGPIYMVLYGSLSINLICWLQLIYV